MRRRSRPFQVQKNAPLHILKNFGNPVFRRDSIMWNFLAEHVSALLTIGIGILAGTGIRIAAEAYAKKDRDRIV